MRGKELQLSTYAPHPGQQVQAIFTVINAGGQLLTIDGLVAGARYGSNWDGSNVDFPAVTNITLQPNQRYNYVAQRAFYMSGNYFAEGAVKLRGGNWGGLSDAVWNYPRRLFRVS